MRGRSLNNGQEKVSEYLQALKKSKKYGPQVVSHRVFAKEDGNYVQFPQSMNKQLTDCLQQFGIKGLFEHQERAFTLIQEGKDLLAATPTSSGKSMIYNLPVLESILTNPKSKALYLFPLKALAQDQLRILQQFEGALNFEENSDRSPFAAIYDGDTSAWYRKKIRVDPPNILITNPDMLHLSFLPYHSNWAHFFGNLQYIVIDEVHTYRGVFGSHMSWVLKRLQRVLQLYGVNPKYILLSATIGNPVNLGEMLIGKPVTTITRSSAPRAKRNMLFLNPWDSAAHTASQLLEAALKRGLRTIVYTGSRKMTELITLWTRPRLGDLSQKVSSYRSGFLPENRRAIEQKLSQGDLLGVISTSALELGINIGDLDVCILVGYPGSIMATWQRGGRVGRGVQESAVILVAQENALDQYFMQNPDDFFERPMESAVLNPLNPEIMKQHLHCAAAELTINRKEYTAFPPVIRQAIGEMTWDSVLLQGSDGQEWFPTRKLPQRQVNLRGSGRLLQIIRQDNGEILGEIDSARALKECHPGAVYLHSAITWLVEKCDLENKEVLVSLFHGSYHTRPMSEKQTEILEIFTRKTYPGYGVSLGKLLVREQVTGYQKRNNRTNKLIATIPLNFPEQNFETVGFWLEIPAVTQNKMENGKLHFMGAIHALEHAMIGMFPLLILCDRNDIGGISCPVHFQTSGAAVFLYDGYPGGIGLCSDAFARIENVLEQTGKTVESCPCETGCPSCVHSPKCGSGNRPIDKAACLVLLKLLQEQEEKRFTSRNFKEIINDNQQKVTEKRKSKKKRKTGLAALPAHYGVFDLETKYSAQEVGGWHLAHKMGISVAVVYDSLLDDFVTYLEDDVERLVDHLLELELVVGFNNRRFDNSVLSGYTNRNLSEMVTMDLLEVVKSRLGYRLSLNRLAQCTLGSEKSADGLQALKWYKQGEIEKICHYCKKDVAITRDLMFHGLEKGFFLFKNKAQKIVRLPVDLATVIQKEIRK